MDKPVVTGIRMYTIQVNNPPPSYPIGYFPRKFRYLRDAKQCAQRAVEAGASMARVEYPDGREIDLRPIITNKGDQT